MGATTVAADAGKRRSAETRSKVRSRSRASETAQVGAASGIETDTVLEQATSLSIEMVSVSVADLSKTAEAVDGQGSVGLEGDFEECEVSSVGWLLSDKCGAELRERWGQVSSGSAWSFYSSASQPQGPGKFARCPAPVAASCKIPTNNAIVIK